VASRPALRALAERAGILPGHRPAGGGPLHRTSDATREALLAALGHDASSEGAAVRSLAALEEELRTARLAETPAGTPTCTPPEARLGRSRVFGLWTNLYTLRSRTNPGFGNLSDLRTLVRLAARHGAAFVGLNPLHALRNRGHEVSPYSPLSRLFRNPLYLDVTRVPELGECERSRRLAASPGLRAQLERLRGADRIEAEAVATLQARLLASLHRAYARRAARGPSARATAFRRYQAGQPLLRDFATFLALEEHLAARGVPRDWRRWPRALRRHDAPEVVAFARAHAREVERHAFVQFELDRQLASVARQARRAGLPLGLYQDLALGSLGSGFDAWRLPDCFVMEASLGAPPDAYARTGQDWGLPPLHPWRAAREDWQIWRWLLDAAFAHAGALRIDHVLGLFRQWWVPAGRPASEGAYVRFPTRALLGVLAEKSRRYQALVIGEDLGTVPPQVAPTLARHGILSSRVLLFERDREGRFPPASRWSPRALATANTHDLPTLPAFWRGRDLVLRRTLGVIRDERELDAARRTRDAERRALARRLVRDGHLAADREPSDAELCRAVHAYLCATPCALVALSLDDLAGETEPVNVPGLSQARHPSWTRRMHLPVEALGRDAGVRIGLAGTAARALR
jgi:4-alpha-glucanotransferase